MHLVNFTYRELRVLMPDGTYQQFRDGQLDVAETISYEDQETGETRTLPNPYYEPLLNFAKGDPLTAILVNTTTCPHCGEVFAGKAAKADLGRHRKENHFELWIADKTADQAAEVQKLLKARANYVCDVCTPLQEYPTETELAFHVNLVHARTAPTMDAEGNEVGGGGEDRRPGEVAPIPTATPTG